MYQIPFEFVQKYELRQLSMKFSKIQEDNIIFFNEYLKIIKNAKNNNIDNTD